MWYDSIQAKHMINLFGRLAASKHEVQLEDLEIQEPLLEEETEDVSANEQQSTAQSQEQSSPQRSTSYLDGLRGIAALCVFNQHLMGAGEYDHGFGANGYYYFISLPFIRVFYNGGAAAVAIFFVLSGFVLSQSVFKLLKDGQQKKCLGYLVSAVVRRPIRLYLPCFAVALIVALLMQLPNKVYPDYPWLQRKGSLSAQLLHWFVECFTYFQPFQTHSWATGKFSYDLVVWTIPIELKGSMLIYLLSAFCCFAIAEQIFSVGMLFCFTVLCLQVGWWSGGCFIAGMMLTIINSYDLDNMYCYHRFASWAKVGLMHLILLVGYYLLSQPVRDGYPQISSDTPGWHFLSSLIPSAYDPDSYYRFWQAYGAILFVYASLRITWIQALFSFSAFQYLGRVSFMLYLSHLPILISIGGRLGRIFGDIPFGSEPSWLDNRLYIPDKGPKGLSTRWDVQWVLLLTITLGTAHVGTILLDQPCVRLGKWCTRRLGLQ